MLSAQFERHPSLPIVAALGLLLAAVPILCADALAQVDSSRTEAVMEGELEEVTIVGVTPMHGTGLERGLVPVHVQVASDDVLRRAHSLDLTAFMEQSLGSVHLSNMGSNPFQPSVVYRGFSGSPLLGLPQGIAVYQDGARINEVFGDVVNWDLIPTSAIAGIELIPGSNPLFGLNALGGALSLQTKSGHTHPGCEATAFGGSFGRIGADVQAGGSVGELGYFATGRTFREDGWRDFSASNAYQGFGKVNWMGSRTALEMSLTLARSDLRGKGAVPTELLDQDRSAIFTYPDDTQNSMGLLTLLGSHRLRPAVELSAVAYGRRTESETFNGDDSDYGACPDEFSVDGFPVAADALCFGGGEESEEEGAEEDGGEEDVYQVFDQVGDPIPFSDDVASATNNTTATLQHSFGGQIQTTISRPVFGRDNHFIIGAGIDGGHVDFNSETELGRLTDERGTIGSGLLDRESFVEMQTSSRNWGLFFLDTFSVTSQFALTISGRYNYTQVTLEDQIGTALNGDHTFSRFNPAIGAAYRFTRALGVYTNVSSSNRAPTPVELTCADPDDPCRIPNGFQADPPLEQAVATTISGGLRGRAFRIQYDLSLFRTDTNDEIYFISAGTARNSGYFSNIGATRRQGIEASLHGRHGPATWYAGYTYQEATFEDALTVNSPNNPESVDGEVSVTAGDRLPLTPRHLFKAGADVRIRGLALGSSLIYNGEQYMRGDEGNLLDPIGGYAVLDVRASVQVHGGFNLIANVSNVLNTEYATAGLLGEPDEIEAFEHFEDPRFLTPGMPRAFRIGIEYEP